jgi:hypothetical protein
MRELKHIEVIHTDFMTKDFKEKNNIPKNKRGLWQIESWRIDNKTWEIEIVEVGD